MAQIDIARCVRHADSVRYNVRCLFDLSISYARVESTMASEPGRST